MEFFNIYVMFLFGVHKFSLLFLDFFLLFEQKYF